MHNQPYVGRIALCTGKKTAKKWRNNGLLSFTVRDQQFYLGLQSTRIKFNPCGAKFHFLL